MFNIKIENNFLKLIENIDGFDMRCVLHTGNVIIK